MEGEHCIFKVSFILLERGLSQRFDQEFRRHFASSQEISGNHKQHGITMLAAQVAILQE